MEKLSVKIKEATYENIFVDCPYCHKELIFNRISDLLTVMPIVGRDLNCEHCKKIFWASCDRVTSAKYHWFLGDRHILKRGKRYGLYIFTLCQACETFMHEAIINKLIDTNPAYRDDEGYFCGKNKAGADADYNEIYEEFCNKKISEITKNGLKDKKLYKEAAFDQLRNLFLYIFDDARKNKLPTLEWIEDKREIYFCVIENTDINVTRNKIVHKYAYRPSLDDVQKYGKEDKEQEDKLIDSLYWLGVYLDVKDSSFYINERILTSSAADTP